MTIIDCHTKLGGGEYPFQQRLSSRWFIEAAELNNDHSEDDSENPPAMRWIRDDGVNSLYCSGGDPLSEMQLSLHTDKGAFPLYKRWSRITRPYWVYGWFNRIDIRYDRTDSKVYDGAGIVSRALLKRLIVRLPAGLPDWKRRMLKKKLLNCQRVEFTIMTARGQDKGHAIVSEDLDCDFSLPQDTKGEVRLTGGPEFVGLYLPHSIDEMRMDVQSLINLHPFINVTHYTEWLSASSAAYLESIRNGSVAERLGFIHPTVKEVFWLQQYYACDGQSMWFKSVVRATANQWLQSLNHTTLEKLRLPVPGSRYYVMPDQVGRDAGLHITVWKGRIKLDPEAGTAWVNAEQWKAELAGIWGGADGDDALWIFPFEDYNGIKKILAWRSPNQLGEYVLFRPTSDSHEIGSWPKLDSRKLPKRIDRAGTQYNGQVADEAPVGQGHAFQVIKLARTAQQRALKNAGALGMYVNQQMIAKALFGKLPDVLPAPLEHVIDATVKTGADTSDVKRWCYKYSQSLMFRQEPIPHMLEHRLAGGPPEDKQIVNTTDHWLDDLYFMVVEHIKAYEAEASALAEQACPPLELLEAMEHENRGALLYGEYADAIRASILINGEPDMDAVQAQVKGYLDSFPEHDHASVMLSMLAHAYRHGKSDSLAFQPLFVQLTLRGLGDYGLMDLFGEDRKPYPAADVQPTRSYRANVHGMWFNWYKAQTPDAVTRMKELPPAEREAWKLRVSEWNWYKAMFHVIEAGERLAAYSTAGRLLGYLDRKTPLSQGQYRIERAQAEDGNLHLIVSAA